MKMLIYMLVVHIIFCTYSACEAWENPAITDNRYNIIDYQYIWGTPKGEKEKDVITDMKENAPSFSPTSRIPLIDIDESERGENLYIPVEKLPASILEPGALLDDYTQSLKNVGFVEAGSYRGNLVYVLKTGKYDAKICSLITIGHSQSKVSGAGILLKDECKYIPLFMGQETSEQKSDPLHVDVVGTNVQSPIEALKGVGILHSDDTYMPRPFGLTAHMVESTASSLLEAQGFVKSNSGNYALADGSVRAQMHIHDGEVQQIDFILDRETQQGMSFMKMIYFFEDTSIPVLRYKTAEIRGSDCTVGICRSVSFQYIN